MSAPLLLFGHGVPLDDPLLSGLTVSDVTRRHPADPAQSQIAPLLEPFLDPFVRGFLHGLESGAFANAAAIVIWRQGAGALHAYRYACELRRLGLLPNAPVLHLWNRVEGGSAAHRAFNRAQDAALASALSDLRRTAIADRNRPLQALAALQSAGQISGAAAFARRLKARESAGLVDATADDAPPRRGPRLALAGAPLGGDGLHRWLDARGALVLDLQGPDAPQERLPGLLRAHRVETLVWQVDPNDDLHGWRMPGLRALCADLGIRFVDLGFVDTWPQPSDLPPDLHEVL